MRTNELIRKYLICHHKNNRNFLKENRMLCLCVKDGTDEDFDKEKNNINCLYNQKIVCAIDRLLRDKGIQYVIFKGLCLAKLLYDSTNDRKVGDIDIYVDYDRHNETMKNHGNENTPDTICGIEELVLDVDIAQLIRENNLTCNNCTTRLMPCSRVCYASKPNYFIFDEKNQFLKCSFALDSPNNIIGILDEKGSFIENKNNYYNWVYRDYLTSDKCNTCKILPLCFGKSCPKSLIQFGEMQCNTDIIEAEIEGLLNSYY